MREMSAAQMIERSITKTYRDTVWNPFIRAMKQYELLHKGDKVAVCISGGKDSMLLAKLMQMLQRYSDFPFGLEFLVMDPGYNAENRKKIEENARILEIPITVFETNIFDVADQAEKYPCYLCAKMRRGHLYKKAQEMGCNKIALGHHFSDVIETTVLSLFYGSQLQGMMPKLHSKVTERIAHSEDGTGDSKRQEIKLLLRELKKTNPNIENSIFNAIHAVHIDTFPGYKSKGEDHSFLEKYDDR